ncbi:MAG: hypothetical protein QXF01_01570 [Candidatus Micrarchaeaceae archaeon]
MGNEGVPAWLLCEDMLTRVKDELVLEAIDILKKEMSEGRININGYVAVLPEKSQELEQDLFVLNNLISNANEIRQQYREYLEKEKRGEITDPGVIARGEGLKKFLMAVDAIELLMHTSRIYGMWADDVGVYSSFADPVAIMVKSGMLDEGRTEALELVLSSKAFALSEALDIDEMQILRNTLEVLKGRQESRLAAAGMGSTPGPTA